MEYDGKPRLVMLYNCGFLVHCNFLLFTSIEWSELERYVEFPCEILIYYWKIDYYFKLFSQGLLGNTFMLKLKKHVYYNKGPATLPGLYQTTQTWTINWCPTLSFRHQTCVEDNLN